MSDGNQSDDDQSDGNQSDDNQSDNQITLRQDNTIEDKVSNLLWDLQDMQPGFIIQLSVHQVTQQQDQNNQHLFSAITTIKPDTFLYMQDTHFESYSGMFNFLYDTLADEGLTVDNEWRFLCDKGLHLLRHDASRMLLFPQSVRIYTLTELTKCALKYVKSLRSSIKSNRVLKFIPIAMNLTVVRYQQLQLRGIDDVELVRSIKADCVICFEKLGVGKLASCTPCAHVFHRKCIASWLKNSQSSCPLCRADLSQKF